ncbi:MAG TPA: hypothetical protein VEI97_01050 [bacterium]|nr:hypothetical protein [bacterium]
MFRPLLLLLGAGLLWGAPAFAAPALWSPLTPPQPFNAGALTGSIAYVPDALYTRPDGVVVPRRVLIALDLPLTPPADGVYVLPVRLRGVSQGQMVRIQGHLPPMGPAGARADYLGLHVDASSETVSGGKPDLYARFTAFDGAMDSTDRDGVEWDYLAGYGSEFAFTGDQDFAIEVQPGTFGSDPKGNPIAAADLQILLVVSLHRAEGAAANDDHLGPGFPVAPGQGIASPKADPAAVAAFTATPVPALTQAPPSGEMVKAWGLQGLLHYDEQEELLTRAYPGWAWAEPEAYKRHGAPPFKRCFHLTKAGQPARWVVTHETCNNKGVCHYSTEEHATPPWAPVTAAKGG